MLKFKNRYGKIVEFVRLKKNTYAFSVKDINGAPSVFWRWGWDTDSNQIIYIDPSGGPFIEIGTDLYRLLPKKSKLSKIVTKIYKDKLGRVILITVN